MISAFKQNSPSRSKVVCPSTRGASLIRSFYIVAARLDRFGFAMLRLGLVIVLCWIGGLKATNFEAEGIVPYVANSPLMSFFYHHPAPEYREQNPAGALNVANHEWNETNARDLRRRPVRILGPPCKEPKEIGKAIEIDNNFGILKLGGVLQGTDTSFGAAATSILPFCT